MRYVVNKNQALRSVKAIKSLLELTRPIFKDYSLSVIKQEYSELMGYRNWNELVHFSENVKHPIISLNEIKAEGLKLFIELFGKSSLIRILNNQQYPVPEMFLSFNKKTINYLKYIDQIPEWRIDYIKTKKDDAFVLERSMAYFRTFHKFGEPADKRGVHLNVNALKAYNNICDFSVFYIGTNKLKDVDKWIENPVGVMSVGGIPGKGKSLFIEVYVIRKLIKNNKKVALLKYHENLPYRNQYSFLHDMPIINENQISQYDVIYIDGIYEKLRPEIFKQLNQSKTALIVSYQDDHRFHTPLIASTKLLGTEPQICLTL